MPKRYDVLFTERAKKQFEKLDKYNAGMILNWIRKNLVGCEDPRAKGKALVGNLEGWRYRVGDYRILAEIRDGEVLILVVEVGYRREIYR